MNWMSWTFNQIASGEDAMQSDYDRRKLDKTEVNGLKVSTVWVDDFGCYETAIIDAGDVYPVERYDNEGEAIAGHQAWIAKATEGLTTVTRLGTPDGWVDDEDFTLVPDTNA